MEWISVVMQRPKDEQEVIVYFMNSAGNHVSTAVWDGFDFFDLCEDCNYKERYYPGAIITHWMPLPEPPKI